MIRNITLSSEEALIAMARDRARRQHTTLNAVFRRWLERYVAEDTAPKGFMGLMAKLEPVQPGRTFTRDEMNER